MAEWNKALGEQFATQQPAVGLRKTNSMVLDEAMYAELRPEPKPAPREQLEVSSSEAGMSRQTVQNGVRAGRKERPNLRRAWGDDRWKNMSMTGGVGGDTAVWQQATVGGRDGHTMRFDSGHKDEASVRETKVQKSTLGQYGAGSNVF